MITIRAIDTQQPVYVPRSFDSVCCPFCLATYKTEEIELPHIAKGDYRESTDTIWLYQPYDTIHIDENRKITTSLHRQFKGSIEIFPYPNETTNFLRSRYYIPFQQRDHVWYRAVTRKGKTTYQKTITAVRQLDDGAFISVSVQNDESYKPGFWNISEGVYSLQPSSSSHRAVVPNPTSDYPNRLEVRYYNVSPTPEQRSFISKCYNRGGTYAECMEAVDVIASIAKVQTRAVYEYGTRLSNYTLPPISVHDLDSISLSDLSSCKLPYVDSNYLAQQAYQDIGYIDNNAIAYIKDSLELKSLVTGLASSLRGILKSKGKKRAQAAAQFYLGEHYGAKLQILDTVDYVKGLLALDKEQQSTLRRCAASQTLTNEFWNGTATYQCFYRWEPNNDFEVISELLRKLDLVPTMENIWDMVPLSFVVDWFISLGDELTALDNVKYLNSVYSVKGWTLTTRLEKAVQLPFELPESSSSLTEVYFSRRIGKVPITPLPPINDAQQTSSLPSHFCEGAALVVTRV